MALVIGTASGFMLTCENNVEFNRKPLEVFDESLKCFCKFISSKLKKNNRLKIHQFESLNIGMALAIEYFKCEIIIKLGVLR